MAVWKNEQGFTIKMNSFTKEFLQKFYDFKLVKTEAIFPLVKKIEKHLKTRQNLYQYSLNWL